MVNKSRSEKKLNQNQSMCANAKMYTPTKKKTKMDTKRKTQKTKQQQPAYWFKHCEQMQARACMWKNISDVSRRKRKTAKNKYK